GVRPTEPRRPDQPMRERLELAPILDLLSRPSIVFTGAVAIICDFTWQGVASFLPTFLENFRGYSGTLSGTLFAVYFVIQGVLQVAVGSVADRFGRDVATALCMGAGIAGFGLLVAGPGIAAVSAGIVLLGLGMGWGAAVIPRFMDQLSDEERGAGFGLVRTVYMMIAATGSVATGTVADQFGWAASFTMLAVLMAVVLVLLGANWLLGSEY
ncbi:MFS transporter, partial [Natronoarchaeum mannanilyticum]